MEDDKPTLCEDESGAHMLTIKDGGLTLYTMDTRQLEDSAYFWGRYSQLSAARRARVDRYRLPRDKRLSLGAGILLDRGLRAYGL